MKLHTCVARIRSCASLSVAAPTHRFLVVDVDNRHEHLVVYVFRQLVERSEDLDKQESRLTWKTSRNFIQAVKVP